MALCLALFNVAITIQSYVSTKLDPAQILVWMPLTLMLDIGAMLQMVVLILEIEGYSIGVLLGALKDQILIIGGIFAEAFHKSEEKGEIIPLGRRNGSNARPAATAHHSADNGVTTGIQQGLPEQTTSETAEMTEADLGAERESMAANHQRTRTDRRSEMDQESELDREIANARWAMTKHALIAIFATILGIALFVLQMYGLAAAKSGLKKKNLTVKWCSPTFRDFALAVTTGNCERYRIIESSSNGIGCIELPAYQQEDWLKGTVAILSISLVCQVVDLLLVKFAGRTKNGQHRRVRGTRLRRPWCTLFIGPLIFFILIYYGTTSANQLPKGVTDVVWIYRKEPMADLGRVCRGSLKSPGLRGMIIGWTDGLFDSWGSLYHGRVLRRKSPHEL